MPVEANGAVAELICELAGATVPYYDNDAWCEGRRLAAS